MPGIKGPHNEGRGPLIPADSSQLALGTSFCLIGTKTRHEVQVLGTSTAIDGQSLRHSSTLTRSLDSGKGGRPASNDFPKTPVRLLLRIVRSGSPRLGWRLGPYNRPNVPKLYRAKERCYIAQSLLDAAPPTGR